MPQFRGYEKVGAFVRCLECRREIQFVYERFNSFENIWGWPTFEGGI